MLEKRGRLLYPAPYFEGERAGGESEGGIVTYDSFLQRKSQLAPDAGFEPILVPDFLFPFQRALVEWGIRKGRAAFFADCGLGKSPMQLVWAENVVLHSNKPVLIATPLAVAAQTLREAAKFGIEAHVSRDGKVYPGINITNYERLHHFDSAAFAGMVCDESSILKNFDGKRKAIVTEFLRMMPYRLLCTATAAPNDYIELGTSSEALGELGHMDMLQRFFRNTQNTIKPMVYRHRGKDFAQLDDAAKWRFKKHAEVHFWRWVASWARAVRRPSDLGFSDDRFVLPPLAEREHVIKARASRPDMLFDLPAVGLHEQRDERRRSIEERCEKVAELVSTKDQALVWCHLNPEGDLLEKLIPGAVQVSGSDDDDAKEERLTDFANGEVRVLVTKPKIGCLGLNLQRCAHVTFFPSHSYEQYYQGVRRCWRFGQSRPVVVDVVASEGERGVMRNLQRKAAQADQMFTALVEQMNAAVRVAVDRSYPNEVQVPAWA